MFFTPLGFVIAFLSAGKPNSQWSCLSSTLSVQVPITLPVPSFSPSLLVYGATHVRITQDCNRVGLCIYVLEFPAVTWSFCSPKKSRCCHSTPASSSEYPSLPLSSTDDQQEPRIQIRPIKLTGRCCAGANICLRSHYKHTSTS